MIKKVVNELGCVGSCAVMTAIVMIIIITIILLLWWREIAIWLL